MLQDVDITTGVIQCIEKISKENIPQMRAFGSVKREKKQSSKCSGPTKQIFPQNYKFGIIQSIQHSHYLLRVQVPIFYDYFAFSKVYQVRSKGRL